MIIVYIKSLLFNGISGVPEPKDLGWLIWNNLLWDLLLIIQKLYQENTSILVCDLSLFNHWYA
jgi:hypothetical protein